MSIARVQLIRKAVLAFAVAVGALIFTFTNSDLGAAASVHEMIEWIGIVAIVLCIGGRCWASLYIGGRKIEQFVTDGPYSVMRNPLYFFSILGAFGVGAQLGSITTALVCGVLAWMVFSVVVRHEERLMEQLHGDAYLAYLARVPRFLPRPTLWQDVPTLTIMPGRVVRTFGDAMLFLLAVPIAEGIEVLQNAGVIPVLLRLP